MDWFMKRRIRQCIDEKIIISKNDHTFFKNSKKIPRTHDWKKTPKKQEYCKNSEKFGIVTLDMKFHFIQIKLVAVLFCPMLNLYINHSWNSLLYHLHYLNQSCEKHHEAYGEPALANSFLRFDLCDLLEIN